MELMRRLFASFLVLFTLVLGCSRPVEQGAAAADSGQPVQGDSVVVRLEAEPDTLNPVNYVSAVSQYVLTGAKNSQVYELLMGYNTKDWDVTEPLLAEGPPTVSADHLTYTITIRDGVKW